MDFTNELLRKVLGNRRMFSIRSDPDSEENEGIELVVEFQTFTHDFEDFKPTLSTVQRGMSRSDASINCYMIIY